MEHVLKLLAQHWALSPTQYWHFRLLMALSLGPLLAILYLVFFDRRARRKASVATGSQPSMWVGSDGRLLFSQ
jgi:hypothetical protein